MEGKKLLYSRLNEINDLEIRGFVKEALDNAPEGFWIIACSGTGKYHPPEDQGDQGLIRHLIKCIELSKDLCIYFNLSQGDRDIVLAGIFLHDIQKFGDPWGESSDPEHARIGAEFLEKFSLKEPEKTEIMNCVRYHFGRFTNTKEDFERACNPNKKELIVQLSDLFCSRKYASWLPGVNVAQENIDNFLNKFQEEIENGK